jgi:pilus assembly protein CpaB
MNLPKGISYIVLAGVAGLVATFTIHRYVSVKTQVPVAATGQVVVSSTEVSPGTALNAQLVKVATWPKELVPANSTVTMKEVEGRVVLTSLAPGELVLRNKLAPEGTAAGLGSLLGENQRAFTIRVDDVSGVAGFIHPGDKVDILADLTIPKASENFSKTILQNVMVLTTGQIWEQKGESKPVVVNTVTLALAPEEAETLNLASNVGKIRLALRNRNNVAMVQTKGVATSTLFKFGLLRTAADDEKKDEKKDERTVEVIKGMERSKASM